MYTAPPPNDEELMQAASRSVITSQLEFALCRKQVDDPFRLHLVDNHRRVAVALAGHGGAHSG